MVIISFSQESYIVAENDPSGIVTVVLELAEVIVPTQRNIGMQLQTSNLTSEGMFH